MREAVKHYTGYEITDEIIRKINLIELKRIKEGITYIKSEPIKTLRDLCKIHGTFPKEENVIIGQDWYIIYSRLYEDASEIEINEWVAINKVENKLMQTIEMLSAMKKILLENKDITVFATMRHSTSYKFYKSLLTRGYFKELSNRADIDDELPEYLEPIKTELKNKYETPEVFLQNLDNENLQDTRFEDIIHHLIIFKPTDKFIKRYKK